MNSPNRPTEPDALRKAPRPSPRSLAWGLKSFFRRLWGGLKSTGNLFSKLFGTDALESFQLAARLLLASALGRIVFSVVEELSTLDITNDEKRRLAFERIVAAARQAGLDYKDSLIIDLSSWLAGFAPAFGMGKITTTQPDPTNDPNAYQHVIVFSDPAVSKQVPITTYSEQISTAANLNRKIADAAVNSFNLAGRIGPDAGPMALSIEAIASGIEAAGLPTYPALASPEPGLLFNRDVDILLGTEGSPTSIKDRVVEWSVGIGQNLLADQGYFAGSGKFRGRLWHGRRDVNVSLVLFIDGSSDFKDKFDGETKEELKITVTGALIAAAVNHQMTIRLPAIRLPNLAYAEEVGMMTYRIDIGPEGVFRGATLTEPIEFKIINEEASFLDTM